METIYSQPATIWVGIFHMHTFLLMYLLKPAWIEPRNCGGWVGCFSSLEVLLEIKLEVLKLQQRNEQ